MSNKSIFKNLKSEKAFTLIELLVVVAIIGILSTVVVVSLNAAREKNKIASITSTLKQLYNRAAINQVTNGSFTGSNPSYSDLTCTGNLAPIAKPLEDQGIVVKCFSFYGSGSGGVYAGDNYNRFAATALIYDTGELKAWSVDENGGVKWDTRSVTSAGASLPGDDVLGSNTMNWSTAKTACTTNGGRLPSLEQLRTLSHSWYQGSGNTTYTPLGFVANSYWSSTPVPSSPLSLAYVQGMVDGGLGRYSQGSGGYVRCVR
jgi:prepilin-type N-terminal cleavage/methylation domain-containing protein